MSFNMRDYVSDDHIESIGEIAKSQSAIIQALSLDNSQKDKEIERLNNRIENAKHFIDQVLGYHLSSGYEQLDKDVNELYGILMGVDKE